MDHRKLHTCFSLNGNFFMDHHNLLEYSRSLSPEIFNFLSEWFDKNPELIVHTSGSTGKPKQIRIKKEYMINSALATGEFFELSKKINALLCMPVGFIAGKMMLVRAMVLGWQLDVIEPASKPLKEIKNNYEFSAMVPFQLNHALDKMFLIKKLIVGGGAVSKELQTEIQDLSTEIYATYGMTETLTHIAVKPLNKQAVKRLGFEGFYQTLLGITVSRDDRGCLVINAPGIADDKLITNDMVKIISENRFEWLGRYDHVINSGGVKLIPEVIEEKISDLISKRFYISSQADPVLGEKLILIIEGTEIPELSKKIRDLVAKYENPKIIYYIDHFIETASGKIDRIRTKQKIRL